MGLLSKLFKKDELGEPICEPFTCTQIYYTKKYWIEHTVPTKQRKSHHMCMGLIGEIKFLAHGTGESKEDAHESMLKKFKELKKIKQYITQTKKEIK